MSEERIAISIVSGRCRSMREVIAGYSIVKKECLSDGMYCSAYIHGPWQRIDPEKDCKNCKRAEYNGMTVGEAIERMAKAMCEKDTSIKWEKNGVVYQHIYKDLAKAALEALIKKEE